MRVSVIMPETAVGAFMRVMNEQKIPMNIESLHGFDMGTTLDIEGIKAPKPKTKKGHGGRPRGGGPSATKIIKDQFIGGTVLRRDDVIEAAIKAGKKRAYVMATINDFILRGILIDLGDGNLRMREEAQND